MVGVVRAVKLSDLQSVTARAKLLAAGEVGQGPTVAENCEARRRDGGGGGTRRGESARSAVAEVMSRAAEAWEVEGGGEVKERERERERWREEREGGSESKRGTRACAVWSCLQGSDAGAAAGALVAAAAARGMRAEKKVRRVRPERALAPTIDCPSLGCFCLSIIDIWLIASNNSVWTGNYVCTKEK